MSSKDHPPFTAAHSPQRLWVNQLPQVDAANHHEHSHCCKDRQPDTVLVLQCNKKGVSGAVA
jgi:hypothetical protein